MGMQYFMMSEVIGRANNCIPPTYLHNYDNIVLRFYKIIENIGENSCLVFLSFYFEILFSICIKFFSNKLVEYITSIS